MERDDYTAIPKDSGFMYACENMYHRVKTRGNVKYLKCSNVGCDASAKIVFSGGKWFVSFTDVFSPNACLSKTNFDLFSLRVAVGTLFGISLPQLPVIARLYLCCHQLRQ